MSTLIDPHSVILMASLLGGLMALVRQSDVVGANGFGPYWADSAPYAAKPFGRDRIETVNTRIP